MKRVLCNALAAIAAASTLMLAGTRIAEAATPKDMLVMATLLDEFTTLDPGEIYELVPQEYVANTYDRLIRVDLKDPAHFNGDVAQSWAVSPDGLTFTFKIRPGLKFTRVIRLPPATSRGRSSAPRYSIKARPPCWP